MDWRERIVVDPAVLVGKPIVKGPRISVELVVDLLAQGWSLDQVVEEYPGLRIEDVRACLSYASDLLEAESVHPL